ncbi:hypothetical protein [Polaromonas sp.]|uniref:hypothetical protein n=1 Tax=Polaromonas sp. TaxID=1869339 RepID=UPI002FC98CF9
MTGQEFSKAALDDCQLTIRALDVKCGAVLVLLLAPLPSVSRIFSAIEKLPASWPLLLGVLFFAAWAAAMLSLIRALAPLDNPSVHLLDSKSYTGAYYRGGLYEFGFIDALLRRSVIFANKKVADAMLDIPQTDVRVQEELTFEHMKLCYIRDVKIRLLKWGIGFAEAWLVFGTVIYLMGRYLNP